jgi:hypothetical protein
MSAASAEDETAVSSVKPNAAPAAISFDLPIVFSLHIDFVMKSLDGRRFRGQSDSGSGDLRKAFLNEAYYAPANSQRGFFAVWLSASAASRRFVAAPPRTKSFARRAR